MSFLESLFGVRHAPIEVVITDVTRMQRDKVCIAALHQGKSMRLDNPAPREQWLQSMGGLAPGDVVSLTWRVARRYSRPHSEDGEWNPAAFAKGDRLLEDDLVALLVTKVFRSVGDAFGKPCFYSENGNAAFTAGKGARSLASVTVSSVSPYPHADGVRADFVDAKQEWKMVPVEDLAVRNHRARCQACSSDFSSLLESEFQGGQAILRVGLGRPFQWGDRPPACYLQVNHIFLIPSKRQHFV